MLVHPQVHTEMRRPAVELKAPPPKKKGETPDFNCHKHRKKALLKTSCRHIHLDKLNLVGGFNPSEKY